MQIDHSWRGDLQLLLSGPDGVEIPVVAFESGDSANDVDDVFTVFGADETTDDAGTWTLRVVDAAFEERGHLLGWSIGINAEAPELTVPGTRSAPR